jgi:hypothetical protein
MKILPTTRDAPCDVAFTSETIPVVRGPRAGWLWFRKWLFLKSKRVVMAYDVWDEDESERDENDALDDEAEEEVACPHCGRFIYEDSVRCPYCHLYVEGDLVVTNRRGGWNLLYRLAAVTLLALFLGPALLMLWMLLRHGLP